jgi:hypothetical protein
MWYCDFDMQDENFRNRVAQLLAEELDSPEQWHYVSFADKVFKGAVVIRVHGITDALLKINALRQNPGGEVLCVPIPRDKVPEAKFCNRLLTKEEVSEAMGESKSLRKWEAQVQL